MQENLICSVWDILQVLKLKELENSSHKQCRHIVHPLCVISGLLSVLHRWRSPCPSGERCLPYWQEARLILLVRIISAMKNLLTWMKEVFIGDKDN